MRAHGEVSAASIAVRAGGTLEATLDLPVRGIAAGQALVAYEPSAAGDIVLGSATITEAFAAAIAA